MPFLSQVSHSTPPHLSPTPDLVPRHPVAHPAITDLTVKAGMQVPTRSCISNKEKKNAWPSERRHVDINSNINLIAIYRSSSLDTLLKVRRDATVPLLRENRRVFNTCVSPCGDVADNRLLTRVRIVAAVRSVLVEARLVEFLRVGHGHAGVLGGIIGVVPGRVG
jgi:hypothetical protein